MLTSTYAIIVQNAYTSTVVMHFAFFFFFPFFVFLKDKWKKWMIVMECVERETIKKNQENLIFNEIDF